MSTNGKRKLASPDEMQKHVDDLVESGAIILGHGKRLRVGDDGLLQVADPVRSSTLTPYSDSLKRLANAIGYLESSAGPKSVGWCDALNKLRLLDSDCERNDQLDICAWKICKLAHKKTVNDIAYMDLLQNVFPRSDLYPGYSESEWSDNNHSVLEFPQRACRLLGICSSDDYREQAWDDSLANEMLEKDLEAYRLIDRCFKLLVKFERSHLAYCEYQDGSEVRKYLRLFMELPSIQTLQNVMETEHFLILERKAKTAQRVQANQAKPTPRKRAAPKQEVDSD
ncbi:hypothetical protein N0V84_003880 [Fusarium piperis]|uniref:Uncharacterized protein n=1 Tax=Fusarium piperis TaxID=1435070 RepID=A0A9W8WGV8_9HYPO|nr:hypothetical protein N0V84_003880 [Fusarium piperis]